MTRVRLGWVWFVALMVAIMVAGCGGDDSNPAPDAAKTDVKSDTPATSDVRTDATDARLDTTPSDAPPTDTPVSEPPVVVPDAPTDTVRPDADAGQPPLDARTDPTVDVTSDPAVPPDADASVPPPDGADATPPPPPDAPDAGMCTADNQCPSNKPHCNTNTGACVSRTSIAVTPTNPTIALGTTLQFAATATYSDNSTGTVTTQVTWVSLTPAVATINPSTGLATSVVKGSSIVTATLGGIAGQTTLTVTDATLNSIQVNPPSASIPVGLTQQFMVIGTYSDTTTQDLTTQATWTSSQTNFATVGTNTGIATGVALGNTVIAAAFGGKTATANLAVTSATLKNLTVTPAIKTIARQTIQQFQVTGTYTDNTSQNLTAVSTWTSSDLAIATVSDFTGSKGLATGTGAGVATITAAYGAMMGTATLTVTGATLTSITVSPAAPTIANGLVSQFTATGTYSDSNTQILTTLVTWSSSDTGVGIISNAPGSQGLATSVSPGTTTITAQLGAVAGTATLTVTTATLVSIELRPPNPSIAKGTTQQFTAVGTYTDNSTPDITTQVTWGSSDGSIAPISNAVGTEGRATGQTTGTVSITATLAAKSASTNLTVTTAVLSAIGITPLNPTVAKGNQVQFKAIATYSDQTQVDATTSVVWNSSDLAKATISNASGSEGLALGADVGSVTISAASGVIAGSTTLTVSAADLVSITVTPPNPSIPKGTTVQLVAIGNYTDNTTQDLSALASWSSGNSGVATVNGTGLVTGNNTGNNSITANYKGVSGSTGITVTTAVLTAISVTPAGSSTPAGTDKQFRATGTYTDGSPADLTTLVTWASSNAGTATISNTVGSLGLAHGVAEGTVNITATLGTISGTTDFHVTPATLSTIQVTPPSPTIAKGATQQFAATGIYSDNSNVDLTASVTWSSSSTAIATISNVGVSKGLANGVNAGSSNITATYQGTSGMVVLTVTNAALQSITVAPATPTIAKGSTIQLTATGHYSDGSSQNLTNLANWASDDVSHATVSNVVGTQGVVTGAGAGGATITATYSIAGSTTITVTNATLSTITLSPLTPSIAKGTTQQFAATGHYSDATTQVLTTQVTWGSSAPQYATVSNTVGTQGLATGVSGLGTSSITASLGGIQGSTTITVTAATLTSVSVAPVNGNVSMSAVNKTVQFSATGSYSDATQQTITTLCTWSSLTPATATISNAAGTIGLATAAAVGTTTIQAACPTSGAPVSSSTPLNVVP